MSLRQYAQLILLSLMWGISFLAGKVALEQYMPLHVLFYRVLLAGMFLGLILLIMRRPLPKNIQFWRFVIVMSVLNNVIPMFLIFWSMKTLSSGMASILNATTPLFAVIVMHYFAKGERATPAKWLGCVLGLIGVAVLADKANFSWGDGKEIWAMLAGLGAALSYAISGLWGRKAKALNALAIDVATAQLFVSSVIIMMIGIATNTDMFLMPQSPRVALAIGSLAIISTALAYLIFFRLLETAGPTNLMLVTFLIPISALLMGAIFLNETYTMKHFIGMISIAGGLILIDGRAIPWLFAKRRGL